MTCLKVFGICQYDFIFTGHENLLAIYLHDKDVFSHFSLLCIFFYSYPSEMREISETGVLSKGRVNLCIC